MWRRYFITGGMALLILVAAVGDVHAVDAATSKLINQKIRDRLEDIIKIRRFLHMNPELSNREFETAKLVASKLLSLGFEVKAGIAKTGVTGLLRGAKPGITIGMRADMDALPIQEKTQVPYQSLNPGVMHACGHDIHTAVALGTAMVLADLKDRVRGGIKFIFQPAEEGAPPGESGGAARMLQEGVLENPPVRAVFGLHVWPEIPVGSVMFAPGPVLASSDGFTLTIEGKSAHGARPHEGVDAVVLAARTVTAVQTIASRAIDPTQSVVITIGRISGGLRANIIAPNVTLDGTVRTHNPEVRVRIESLIEELVKGITQPAGAGYTFNYRRGTAPVYNHPELAAIMMPVLEKVVGAENLLPLIPQMVAEDFSAFSEAVPGFYFMLGVRPSGHKTMHPLHSPRFNPDERSIALGIRLCCHLLLDCLDHPASLRSGGN